MGCFVHAESSRFQFVDFKSFLGSSVSDESTEVTPAPGCPIKLAHLVVVRRLAHLVLVHRLSNSNLVVHPWLSNLLFLVIQAKSHNFQVKNLLET